MNHRSARKHLVDYISGELDSSGEDKVRRHLDWCDQCSRELTRIRDVMRHLEGSEPDPASRLDPDYWNSFQASVMQRVRSGTGNPGYHRLSVMTGILSSLWYRPAYRAGLAVVIPALVIILFIMTRTTRRQSPEHQPETETATPAVQSSERIQTYLRKSRTLLVALNNVEAQPDGRIDLTLEQKLSRDLASELPAISMLEIDPRSSRLVTDLGTLFQQVSSTGTDGRKLEIDKIRQNIRRQNLLFKVRMAESAHTGVHFVNTSREQSQ